MKWLNSTFTEEGYVPTPPDGLSTEEALIAERIQKAFEKAELFKRYSKVYQQVLDGTERFYEMLIRALSALIRIDRLGEEARDINVLCKKILDIFSRELGFENCSIMLKDTDDKHLVLIAGKGWNDALRPSGGIKEGERLRIKIGEGIAGESARTGHYIYIPDVTKDNRFKQINTDIDITSLISIPVKRDEEIIGVLNFSHATADAFDKNTINLLIFLSTFVGHMIALTRLHNQIASWNEVLKQKIEEKTATLRKKNRELQKIAATDYLTGLYNRRFFFKRLEEEFTRALRYNEHFSLLFVDIDNLKPINDSYGHVAGDEVIKAVAKTLKKIGRKGDVIGRIGGDEFGYILLEAREEESRRFAARLQESLPVLTFGKTKIKPTISIGIASSTNIAFKKYQEIYRAADEALYHAKDKKNFITFFNNYLKEKKQRHQVSQGG